MEYTHERPTTTSLPTIQASRSVALSRDAVDLIAGGVAGTASVVVGHPLDTIKVRVQLRTSGAGGVGSPSSWFRGITAPMSAAAAVNALVFFGHGWSSRVWDRTVGTTTNEGDSKNNRILKNVVCGSFGGFTNCFAICPMEHVKCRLQAQDAVVGKKSVSVRYRGPLHVASDVYSKQGIAGLFRGWNVTCLREIPSFAVYFSLYDVTKEAIGERLSVNRSSSSDLLASVLAGGTAGAASWAVIYPLDVIKTRIQTSPVGSTKPEHRRMWHAGRAIVRERGVSALFRGIGITAFRAFPVNGIVFPMYECTSGWLSDKF